MEEGSFYLIEVFEEEKFSGNQLAVFGLGDNVYVRTMQNIPREINFSETTFITSCSLRSVGYDVRIFTPNSEMPFAEHSTLGTADVIQKEIIGRR